LFAKAKTGKSKNFGQVISQERFSSFKRNPTNTRIMDLLQNCFFFLKTGILAGSFPEGAHFTSEVATIG